MWIRRNVSPTVVVTGLLFLGLGVLGCTALGGWLYSDPTFALSGVSTRFRGSPADTLQIVLTGCNLNDFDLDGLTIEGSPDREWRAGRRVSEQSVVRDEDAGLGGRRWYRSEMPRAGEPPVHAKGDDMLTTQYELNGKIDLATPIGVRRVMIHQLGDVRFDSAGQTSGWTVRNARACRPGMSMIPGQSRHAEAGPGHHVPAGDADHRSPEPARRHLSKPLTYATYLKVDELLELQQPLSDGPEHDEMLFIVIHQVYELWFKQVLHEAGRLQRLLEAGEGLPALGALKRILTILKVLVSQIDVLETMTPLEFLSFRDRLESGSGFQSFQFREFEFALGHKQPSALERYPGRLGAPGPARAPARRSHALGWISPLPCGRGCRGAGRGLARDVTQPITPSAGVQAALVAVYRAGGMAAQVCERMVDLDEGVQEWRYRHVKMVQRTIGTKRGTGARTARNIFCGR